jgi:catechol-2,3-dioxygenase
MPGQDRGSISAGDFPDTKNGKEKWMRPKTDGILESALYVSDVPRSDRFYEETFGFREISEFGERGCAMHVGTRQVLLLFKKGASLATQSPHDGDGELHVAFAIPSAELAHWESWLQTRGIAVKVLLNPLHLHRSNPVNAF